ncbi:uncharacterized protein LOC117584106 [Drosophila guanche]|uniref:Blast:Transcription factor AP-4 n=1 Tax=Drosophila guanche TaxID=7266 RepID=A0A3B0JGI8_DROGU|nr:uncharacterized protein LOC117584106 [Drosophila guanche]SPP81467.1 blast:Transcription factor AP-4 [Drosophila guanche]
MSGVPVAIKTEEVILENAEYNSAEELDEELQLQLEDSGGENTYHIYTSETEHQTIGSQRRQSNMSGTNTSKGGGGGGGSGGGAISDGDGKPVADSEKRIRREIANSNERRRMQSINAGFQSLRSLLPRHEGEKLSKAAILQQTFQYIVELENGKTQLLTQNSELKRQVGEHEAGGGSGESGGNAASGGSYESNSNTTAVAIKKRKLTDNVISIQAISDSSDEGLGSMSPEPMTLLSAGGAAVTKLNSASIIAAKELVEIKKQLEKERSLRRLLEDELQMIKRQLYSVATAPPGTAVAAVSGGSVGGTYIPREVIEHTDNFVRSEDLEELGGTVSYVEIDELTGQQQVVVCSSIEELEADAGTEIITEDHVHEEVILSSNSSTESENEVNVNAIAKAYAEGCTPSAAMLQPILQAAIKATPKVEVERIHEKIVKVKTEKLEQPVPTVHYRQNLETIVEAIRHLEGDHLFSDGNNGSEHRQYSQQNHHHQIVTTSTHHSGVVGVHHQQHHHHRLAQDAPLALTTGKQHAALAELRPFLQIKGNNKVIITAKTAKDGGGLVTTGSSVTPTAIFKVQSSGSAGIGGGNHQGTATIVSGSSVSGGNQQLTITTALKQCRPGVIVAKQLPSS